MSILCMYRPYDIINGAIDKVYVLTIQDQIALSTRPQVLMDYSISKPDVHTSIPLQDTSLNTGQVINSGMIWIFIPGLQY